ncbi:shikimate dehydrogenase [Deinococcus metalli]|uniref:Shikimate dehydrogenase (NADP(+)) n=1 Tax=Deinococcus metalli TaxID=1141878 RepID=A0A7W8KC62_9DEIO|nr:shikimate dehydrogenase [Deinococcus metalli]MBB5375225.1 shikimate dehydrogenase [Deinococcus metalli]GHF30839.1 shikimate dehydrogenase (NADP(+)) [Deinococcus metalli]
MTAQDASALSLQAFLFADPAAHSLSPHMHRAAFQSAGLRGDYTAVRVPAPDLAAAVAGLRRPGVLGANLSLPHKEAALPLLDDLTPAARAIGAVNTIIHRGGRLTGENTDAPGLLEDLREHWPHGEGVPGAVVVLGAGGAARAGVYTALTLLGRDVVVVNRTPERARQLVASWPGAGAWGRLEAADASSVPWTDVALVINASSAGLNNPEQTPLDAAYLRRLPPGALVYDMVYAPPETRLMADARAAGLRAANGLGMLAQQARLAFTAWTGRDVPVTVFREALDSPRSGERK